MSENNLFDKRIVVGGLPRSGSTLLRFVLDTNKQIISGPETAFFTRPLFETQYRRMKLYPQIYQKLGLKESVYFESIKERNSILAFDKLMSSYRELTGNKSKKCWAEKTPNNVFHYHRILNEFDCEIKFISTIRNGLDVVTSEYPKTDPRYKERRYWVSVQQYIDCMKAIYSFDSPKHYIFNYERFCNAPIIEGQNLFEFLELDFDPSVIQNFNKDNVLTRDMTKVIQPKLNAPISNQWVGRWRDKTHVKKIDEFQKSEEAMYFLRKSGYSYDL